MAEQPLMQIRITDQLVFDWSVSFHAVRKSEVEKHQVIGDN